VKLNHPRALVALGAAQIDDDGYQWIELMPVADKARNGPFYFTVTRDDLDAYAASIADQAGLVPVDYDHSEVGSTVAAGWLTGETEIVPAGGENRGGETQDHVSLWGRVKWTPQAAQEIRDGRFKRISPEFSFVDRDKKTGLMTKAKEFIAATLTNRPFFRDMAALAADTGVIWEPETGYQSLRDEINEALNPGQPADSRYWVCDVAMTGDRALVQEYAGDRTWVVPFTRGSDADGDGDTDVQIAPSSDWIEAEQQWIDAATEAATAHRKTLPFNPDQGDDMSDLKVIATELGLAEDATDEQIVAAIKAAKDTKPEVPEGAVVLTKNQVDDLTANAAAGLSAKTELDALKVKTALDGAVLKGKMTPAQRPSFEALASVDFDAFSKAVGELPDGAFKLTARGSGADITGGDDGDTPEPGHVVSAGSLTPVEPETFAVHAKASKALAEAGKKKPSSQEELLEALEAAGYDETVADRIPAGV